MFPCICLTREPFTPKVAGAAPKPSKAYILDCRHCLVQWGESFRKAYKEVSLLRSLLTDKPFLLLTATSTEHMRKQICSDLLLDADDINMVSVVLDRPNVFLHFRGKGASFQVEFEGLIRDLQNLGEKAEKVMIYCRRSTHVQEIYGWMCEKLKYGRDVPLSERVVTMYHGSVTGPHEEFVAEEFPKPESRLRCVIATIAFGMGVDIPDIRRVIHWGPAKTALNYWQEIGRCSRDGGKGRAELHTLGPLMTTRETVAEMIDICREVDDGACLRCKILECLIIKDMDESLLHKLKSRVPKSRACDVHCQCDNCICCNKCRDSITHSE